MHSRCLSAWKSLYFFGWWYRIVGHNTHLVQGATSFLARFFATHYASEKTRLNDGREGKNVALRWQCFLSGTRPVLLIFFPPWSDAPSMLSHNTSARRRIPKLTRAHGWERESAGLSTRTPGGISRLKHLSCWCSICWTSGARPTHPRRAAADTVLGSRHPNASSQPLLPPSPNTHTRRGHGTVPEPAV